MKILIVEDEKHLAESMYLYLTQESYLCEVATNLREAQDKINAYSYDCILLDLMLPGGDGMSLLEELKGSDRHEGVIIISARDALDDKIKGLRLGADDYLAKPFHLPELGARVYSLIRRKSFGSSNLLRINEIEIDFLAKTLKVHSQEVPLTKTEYEVLVFLISNRNRVISKSVLAEHLSGDMADMMDNHSFVYAHLKNLKRKLSDAGCREYIKTVYGMGYRLEV